MITEFKNKEYGQLPVDLGLFDINVNESMFHLYMPIKMAGSNEFRVPQDCQQFQPLIAAAAGRFFRSELKERYVYLTVKHLLVFPDYWGNRGGYHTDGFGTGDLNYVWVDENPTTYSKTKFVDISDDDMESLKQFEEQARWEDEVRHPEKHLLELNPFVVHKVTPVTRYMMRTFVKISVSLEKYNLVGNTHNYLFEYNWQLHDRQTLRNVTSKYQNADFVPQGSTTPPMLQ